MQEGAHTSPVQPPSATHGGGRTAAAEHRLIIAGSGGQGVLTLGRLLCMSAMGEGRMVTYLPSYGAEVRGGTANCQVIISPHMIYSPLVEEADSVIIFNQPSYEKFAGRIKPGGLLVINNSAVETASASGGPGAAMLSLPAADTAAGMGNVVVTNVLMFGAFVRATGIVTEESCLGALRELLGRRKASLLELNLRAFQKGAELAESP